MKKCSVYYFQVKNLMIRLPAMKRKVRFNVFFYQRASVGEKKQKIRIRKMASELRAERVPLTLVGSDEICALVTNARVFVVQFFGPMYSMRLIRASYK